MFITASNPITTARLVYIGTAILLLLYGIFLTLAVICLRYLFARTKRSWILLGYTITSVLATTTFLVVSAILGELILIESAVDPNKTAKVLRLLDLAQQVLYIVQISLADSLLVYRLWVVWGGNYVIIAIPCMLFVGSFTSGIVGVALYHQQIAKHVLIVKLGIGFHSVSLALNVISTALIAGRLLRQSKIIQDYNSDYGRQYLSLMAVFVESGALYTISGLIFIPLYATGNPLTIVFSVFFGASAAIAPILILLRIALGVAFKHGARLTNVLPVSILNFGARSNGSDKNSDVPLRSSAASSNDFS